MSDKPVVGFIGVGLMGWGMAKNVVEKGYPLRVMAHRKREAVDDLIGRGASEVSTPKGMAEQADVIVLCVTGAPQVEDLLRRDDGILAGAREGLTIIDTSTSEPDLTERLYAELGARGITFFDAPLSRTPAHAWDGELTTYVGGPEELVEQWTPLLSTWASVVIPAKGPVGSAHATKLINNLIAIGYAAIWSECYSMISKIGVAPETFREIVSNSGMNCGNFQNYSKYVCDGDPDAHQFALSNCLKDISYYQRLATRNDAATFMSDGALQLLKLGKTMGYEEKNISEMVDIVAKLNGQGERAK
ncbi:NAD(P)-dependent oxidoreductase [Pelagibius sp. Alg239-R121]|uniref:NAD(P)-dependent oxidoreductase n=1 Tax=Pelagibius sp. Alg239-R121 TaxID=2993448 RepID=UPI0024A791B9|nr:NAD(P)-dependent oxidoreductase [Pelagibius sp. Alg239-R121]